MKISALQENLKKGLFVTGNIAGKNVNLPILNNIMIEAKKESIRLISTNLEIGVTSNVRGKTEEEGVFTVDSKIMSDYISLLPNKKVDIEKKDLELIIKSDNYKTVIRGQEADEFPLIPKTDKKTFFKANVNDFKKALSQVIFAVSNNEMRIELSGVLFVYGKKELVLAATDSYRLAEKKIKITSNTEEEGQTIVPAKTLQELNRVLSVVDGGVTENENEITFYISDNQITFELDEIEVFSRLIEGQYPDYKQIIPTNKETSVLINRHEFIRAVKAASIFSKTGINDVNLDFPIGQNKTIISSASGQTGENITELESKVNGKDNGIVINYRYLLDGLSNIKEENVEIEISDGSTPCILRGEKNQEYSYVIMPIKQ